MWYLRGFLPSGSAKCCKLKHFVRCLCSRFKRAVLSHVLCILPQETTLQIETGQQRDPKESWREGRTNAFTHTGKVLHREVFTLRNFCTQTSWSFQTQKLLHKEVLHRELLNTEAFTHREIFTQTRFHTEELSHTEGNFCTKKSLHFTQRNFYTQKLLHREVFAQRRLYTE